MNKDFWYYPLRKHHRLCDQTRPLVAPLIDAFDLTHFCYFFVTKDGDSACLSSNPEWMEFYLYNDLFLYNPFLKAPHLIREGLFFTKNVTDPHYLESKKQAKNFGIEDSLVLIFKVNQEVKGFSLGLSAHEKNYSLFVNEAPLLKRFCREFEKQAEKEIHELASEPINIRPLIGKAFYKNRSHFFLSDGKRADLLSHLNIKIPKLSPREKECLLLYLEGETARSIADALQLSHRTVESYLNNIKNKLNCYHKLELLRKAQEFRDYGLLLP